MDLDTNIAAGTSRGGVEACAQGARMSGGSSHIAVFIYALTGGGAQRRTLTLVQEFATRGHRVDLVVVHSRGSLTGLLPSSVRLVSLEEGWSRLLPAVIRCTGHRGIQTLASTGALARYLRRERPDVLLSAASHVNLIAAWAHRVARVPVRLVLRASNHPSANVRLVPPFQRLIRLTLQWLARRTYPLADAVIAVSNGVADDVARVTGVARASIVTVYSPVVGRWTAQQIAAPLDHPWFAADAPPVVLGAGRLVLQKDFSTLLRAFARVRARRPARLIILGEGGQRQQLEASARSLGIATDVLFPGYVKNPFPWMARAAVFVLSSAWEGLPGVLIEALACGCRIVSTDCPSGPTEILDGGRFGELVPVGDDRAMADAILKGLAGRAHARAPVTAFSTNAAVERYLSVLLNTEPTTATPSRPLAGATETGS